MFDYFMRIKLPSDMGVVKFKEGASASGEYASYLAGKRKRKRLKVCPVAQYWRRLHYSQLLQTAENGLSATQLILGYPFTIVIIRGRELGVIADAIDEERCEWVQAFDERRWAQPADKNAPFIDSIKIIDALPLNPPAMQSGAAIIPAQKPVAN